MKELTEETYVNPVTYERIARIKDAVLNHLRERIISKCVTMDSEPLWETEQIETQEDTTQKRCEDCLRVRLTVQIKEASPIVSFLKKTKRV